MIIFKEFMYMCDMWLLNGAAVEMNKINQLLFYIVVSTYLLLLLLLFFVLIN